VITAQLYIYHVVIVPKEIADGKKKIFSRSSNQLIIHLTKFWVVEREEIFSID